MNFVDDALSADYYDALPGFSKEAIDFFYSDKIGITKDSVIADIGAGTGRICISFLERGNKVIAIEPDSKMREICDKKCLKYPLYQSVDGTDAKMNIEDKSVDFVIASQVYHRFDEKAFQEECERVLKDPKNVLIVWYRIDYEDALYADMLKSVKSCYKKYETRYNTNEVDGSKQEWQENNESAISFFKGNSKMEEVQSDIYLTKDEFLKLGFSLSLFPITHEMNTVSKVLESFDFDTKRYLEDLNNIFAKYSVDEKIKLCFKIQIHQGL